ncbi:probable membrane-associated kinase regulator 1 [Syzygium oleosum]|uniref:probable membrane-associated kinase regulator 1 n=1 Tax=Syzygium oleosum TaxID=219896 RepID=UPI0024B909A6|nr:probable membrane-associated kinase regulator 1 [Syzygium oleosum]
MEERLRYGNNADEDEDEALSLSDLPLHLAGGDSRAAADDGEESRTEEGRREDQDRAGSCGTEDQEFDFGSRVGGPCSSGWRMCATDELFFQGQILPLRLSVSSDSLRDEGRRSVSRSDFVEIGSISTRASSMGSSRSNSHGSSRYSSSSSTSRSSSMTNSSSSRASFHRVNPFHAHPSPKPQIGPSPGKFRTRSLKSPPSSMWEFFRLGLIRTPGIGLAELKPRKSTVNGAADIQCLISRNSSSSSSNGSVNNGGLASGNNKNVEQKTNDSMSKSKNRERFLLNGSFLGGCRCSGDAVSSSVFAVMGGGGQARRASNAGDDDEVVGKIRLMTTAAAAAAAEAKRKASRHRTFEWIKELSHATYPVDS